jgi:hypothetical protein
VLHIALEVFAAGIAAVPIFAIARAARRTGSRRLWYALAAFLILEARLISMILIHTVIAVPHSVEELLDFGGDLAVIAAFTAAFLYGTRWYPERASAKPS